jgi:hypothetical protein
MGTTSWPPRSREIATSQFFRRAGMLDTKIGASNKDDSGDVSSDGFKTMMSGEGGVVSGWQNKVEAAAAHVMPAERLARKHTAKAAPGTAQNKKRTKVTARKSSQP